MKTKFLLAGALFSVLSACSAHAQHSLTQLWSTEASLPVPESVLFSKQGKVLYAALIDGGAAEKDGKGGIAKVGLDGKIINKDWITGLNAPKGMGIWNGKLFVADVTEVVEIDIQSGKIDKKHPVEGSEFLNDVTIDSKGTIFVTDSRTKKVHRIQGGTVTTFVEGLTGPNGALAVGNDLLVLDSGTLKKFSPSKEVTVLAEGMDKSTDGIEQVKSGEFIVSSWVGIVYYVKSDKTVEKLLDTTADKINSADIGYDPAKKIVYVPTFMKNSIVAYQLK